MVQELRVLRPTHVALQTQIGDLDQKMMLRQMELWGTRIIPAIRKELGDLELAGSALPPLPVPDRAAEAAD